MDTLYRLSFRRFVLALAAWCAASAPLGAATYTWEGSASGLWSNSANWSGLLALPLTDDETVFPAITGSRNMTNDLGAGLAIHRVTFSSSGYSLSGSSVALSSTLGVPQLRVTHTSGSTSISVPVSLGESSTFSTVAGGNLATTFGGSVALGSSTLTLDSDGTMGLLGEISGSGGVALTGAGVVTLGGTHSYSGPTAVNTGRLHLSVSASVTASPITLSAGAVLSTATSATVAALTAGGSIAPGNTAIGKLTATGTAAFSNTASAILALDLGAPGTAGTDYDQLSCAGAVTIGAASQLQLTPTGAFAPSLGDSYILLDKTSSGGIGGTFSGLAQNGTVDVGGKRLRISYTGGSGNDIVATVVNATPELATGSTLSYTENQVATAINGVITVTDLDHTTLASATVAITTNFAGSQDILTFTNSGTGNIAGSYNPGNGVMTLSSAGATATLAQWQLALRAIRYQNSSDNPSTLARTVSYTVSDGTANSNTLTSTINITAVNDPPTLTAVDTLTGAFEDTAFTISATSLNIAATNPDPDGPLFGFRIESVTAGTLTKGGVAVTPGSTTLGSGESLVWTPPLDLHGTLNAFTVKAWDGALVSAAAVQVQVDVTSVNDAPSFTVGPDQLITVYSGDQSVPNWASGMSAGPSNESNQSLTFSTVSNSDPSLFLAAPAVSPAGTLTYTPIPGRPGSATIGLRLRDNGGTVNGGGDTSPTRTFVIATTAPLPDSPPVVNTTATGTAMVASNFDTPGTADQPWVDNSTVPGWYAQINNSLTPAGNLKAGDGSLASQSGLFSSGAAGAADRALGSRCSNAGGVGNIAYALVMRNEGSQAARLSRLRYALELWRSGSAAFAPEKATVFYVISDTPPASIASGPNSPVATAGTGFSSLPPGASTQISPNVTHTALDGNQPANRSTVDYLPAVTDLPPIRPGQYLTLKWTDSDESHEDGQQAIDNVRLDFLAVPCIVNASASLVRRPSLAAPDGSADTVEVTLTVTGEGTFSPAGWRISGGRHHGRTGSYNTPATLVYPLSDFASVPPPGFATPVPLTIQDAGDPSCSTDLSLSVSSLVVLGLNGLSGGTSYLQATGVPALFRQSGTRSDPASGFANEITKDPGSGVLLTDPVTLSPGAEKCVTLTAEAQRTGAGFQRSGTLKVELLTFGPQNEIQMLTRDFDINGDGFINGGGELFFPGLNEFNTRQLPAGVNWTSSFRLVGTIPAGATSFRLRITAFTDSSDEILRFRNLTLQQCVDTDGDGVSDAWEWAHGTNPVSAASFFSILNVENTSAETRVTLPTVSGFHYQPLIGSNDLQSWSREAPPTVGDGTSKVIISPNPHSRQFRRYLVVPSQTVQP